MRTLVRSNYNELQCLKVVSVSFYIVCFSAENKYQLIFWVMQSFDLLLVYFVLKRLYAHDSCFCKV